MIRVPRGPVGLLLVLLLLPLFASCGRTVPFLGTDVMSLRILPADPHLYLNETMQLTIEARLADGSLEDVAADPDLDLRVNEPGVLNVLTGGKLMGKEAGASRLYAYFHGAEAYTDVTVAYGLLVQIDAVPLTANMNVGDNLQLSVKGTLSDNTTVDLTSGAFGTTYAPEDRGVVAVTTDGLVFALAVGQTIVHIQHADQKAQMTVTVGSTQRQLVRLEVSPATSQLAASATVQLKVTGTYDDASQADLTNDPITFYSSSAEKVASVNTHGLVQAIAGGEAVITVTHLSLVATTAITVSGGSSLTGIEVQPKTATLSLGGKLQLAVIADYSDGTQMNVTAKAQYTSADSKVALVDASGLVTAEGAGTALVTASYQSAQGTCSVQVQGRHLEVLAIAPLQANLQVGQTLSLKVTGSYDDGSQADLTLAATGTTYQTDPAVASVSADGLILATSVGTAAVQACNSGVCAKIQLTVSGPSLIAVQVQPATAQLNIGQAVQLSVTAKYSDGSSTDVTASASYLSQDTAVARLAPGGKVVAVGPGQTTVTASFGGMQASCQVSVQAPAIVSIAIAPKNVTLGVGGQQQFTVTATYGDGHQMDVTDPANGTTYHSSDPSIVLVAMNGLALAQALGGPVTITARLTTLTDTASVTVGVIEQPVVVALSPDSGLQGSTVRVVFSGSGLLGCSVSTSNPGIAVSAVSASGDGRQLFATFTIAASATTGPAAVQLTNSAGSASTTFTVLPSQPLQDLVVAAGQVVNLQGVQPYHNITIDTGAQVNGIGTEPLQFLATGDITVRGKIVVSGSFGVDGFRNPANGGAAGPGGGGGGGGGDGDGPVPSSGGAGAPSGQSGGTPHGAGTASGDGGGKGAGHGIQGGCGQAGGGAGFGGSGGGGGGTSGVGTGGAGGTANPDGSDFNGGTGGGGGSTCGGNSGGGGGSGGGVLVLTALSGGSITIDGVLSADGGGGGMGFSGTGGAGGGSGGRITVTNSSGNIVIHNTLSARGGDGGRADNGNGGGGAGGGRITIDAGSGTIDDSMGYYDVRGGLGGYSRANGYSGQPGSDGVVEVHR